MNIETHRCQLEMENEHLTPPPAPGADSDSCSDLLEQTYQELRIMAAARMTRESPDHTLQATALVHEAWLRISVETGHQWKNQAHFVGVAAEAMRRILIDSARKRSAAKRGDKKTPLDGEALGVADAHPPGELLIINSALEALEREDPAQARIVVLKFFGGMTNEEVADFLGIGERTVYRQWMCAKAQLAHLVRQSP